MPEVAVKLVAKLLVSPEHLVKVSPLQRSIDLKSKKSLKKPHILTSKVHRSTASRKKPKQLPKELFRPIIGSKYNCSPDRGEPWLDSIKGEPADSPTKKGKIIEHKSKIILLKKQSIDFDQPLPIPTDQTPVEAQPKYIRKKSLNLRKSTSKARAPKN